MSAIVVKTEIEECDDGKPQIEGGGVSGCSVVATVGPQAIVEKTQAALKVASEAKQLNLRLKDQYLLMPHNHQQQQTTKLTTRIGKRSSCTTADQLQADINDRTNLPYKVGSKRFRVQTPVRYTKPPSPPLLQQQQPSPIAPSKCGEIFVTNNAKKWTFVCTYCQKTTRDIGEFVCHIKYKHLLEQYHEDDYDGDEYVTDQRDEVNNDFFNDDGYDNHDQDVRTFLKNSANSASFNLDEPSLIKTQAINKNLASKIPTITQVSSIAKAKTTKSINVTSNEEYFDCGNYLDVSVHTEADELPNNGVKNKSNIKKGHTIQNAKETNNRQVQQKKILVDLLDDEDEKNSLKNARKNTQTKNEIFDYDIEEEDDGVEVINDENNEVEGTEEDNLLLLRSSSIEDTVGDNGSVISKAGSKKYRSHVRGKAYCNLCDKTFQYYSLYRNHMIKHSNITPYKCEYCSKAFKSKQAIRYHMNTHTKEVQYTCPLCPMVYGTENQFITHVLNHESDTCFPCMVCAKILKSDQDREEHLSTHTEERPFGCNYCNKRFRQKHHLSNHLKLHCQYRCDFCKEEFSSTQTQRRPYACASCEEYPEIRIQVEKQRSKSLNNSEVNPLEITAEGGGSQQNADCVDLATDEDDDESETSTSKMARSNLRNRVACQYCTRAYKNSSALNYHMRQKHAHVWRDK